MGEKISEIDCTLYAYLAVLQHIGVSNNSLRTHINECPSLLKYTKQIRTQYLTGIAASTDSSVIFDRAKHLFITKEDGSVSPTLIKICAGVFAIGSMIMYAITHGLLEVGVSLAQNTVLPDLLMLFVYHSNRLLADRLRW